MNEYLAYIGIGFIIAVVYLLMGIGVSRMVAKIKGGEIRLAFVFIWFIVVIV